jgi:hypothetical protein
VNKKKSPEADLEKCRQALASLGYLSEGSVIRRRAGTAGSPYLWTRKVKAKTVSVSLSKEHYQWLRRATRNPRQALRLLDKMSRLSRELLFQTIPGVPRRKKLSRKVLGLI